MVLKTIYIQIIYKFKKYKLTFIIEDLMKRCRSILTSKKQNKIKKKVYS